VQIASIGGVELAYRTAGDAGDDLALLIHGYTGHLGNWALTVPALVDAGYRTLSADNPGHGDSSAPTSFEPYALDAVAASLHALAEGLESPPAVVVGHSMGGAIAEEYAVAFRDDVRALVLVGSAGGSFDGRGMVDDLDTLRAAHAQGGMAAVFDALVAEGRMPEAAETTAERRAFLKREFARTSFAGYEFGNLALRTRRDTLNDLATLDVPVLVVHGEHESPLLIANSAEIAEAIPGARLETIPGAGHSPQFETPEVFADVLLDFLASID
jgi:pimeloyl-ACP methyl ester carboxylesterase